MLNISKQTQEQLFAQSQLKKLETWEYLIDESNENFKYIKNKFFLYENVDKAKLLNIGSWLFTTVPDVFAFYIGNPDYDFWVFMDDFARDLISLWFCTIGMERIDWKLKLVYQPAKNYRQEDWVDKIGRLYIDDEDNLYMLIQTYLVWKIENNLYLLQNGSLNQWKEVPLDSIPQTAGLEEIQETGLSTPALIVVNDSSISIVEKIKPIVYAIDRQVIMNHTQYLQNVESFVIFKGIKRPEKLLQDYHKWKRIDFSQIGRIINGDENSSVEFVNNTNSLIKTSIEDMDNQVRRVSSVSTIPIEFLGLDSNEWAVGQGSRTLRHGAFMKKVSYYRDLLDDALEIFVELSKDEVSYVWPDVFAKTDNELVEELSTAREAQIISQYNAIKQYNNYTDEETIQEIELINWETAPVVDTTLDDNQNINDEWS